MKRTIIKIDKSLCNGCGVCIKGCHEGALQLIDGKAVLISELYCDGLGACLGECPQKAILLEEREAEAYDERTVIQRMLPQGEKVIIAHLRHLAAHQQHNYIREALEVLYENNIPIPDFQENTQIITSEIQPQHSVSNHPGITIPAGGCLSSSYIPDKTPLSQVSELQQWPIQLHLIPPTALWLKKADLLVAADCTAFAVGDFHSVWLQGKRLAIACPKLDHSRDIYLEKLITMIDQGGINTLTVMIMEVPCCSGLLRLCQEARQKANRHIPLKGIKVSLQGEILQEEWL